MQLICPAGTPAALRDAVELGADAVYCGFRDETNARNFPGLNFSRHELESEIAYAHSKGVHVLVAINTFMRAGDEALWYRAADDAVGMGADALILADFGLMAYVAEKYPGQRLHVSVQASASNRDAISFLVEAFGAKRVVLPRILTVHDIARLTRQIDCEVDVFLLAARQGGQHLAGRGIERLDALPRCRRLPAAVDEQHLVPVREEGRRDVPIRWTHFARAPVPVRPATFGVDGPLANYRFPRGL